MKSAPSRSVKPLAAKRKPASMKSGTDWSRLNAASEPVPTNTHPEANIRHIVRGVARRDLQRLR